MKLDRAPSGSVTYRQAVILSDNDIARLVPMPLAADALEEALRDEARGLAQTMARTRLGWAGGRMQSLGGHLGGRSCAAVKSWVVAANQAQPTLLLFSLVDGQVMAIMEAAELGRIRTGALSAVATRHMAAAHAGVLLVIGTGRQARAQVAGALAARAFHTVLIAARDAAKAAAFAHQTEDSFEIDCQVVASVREAATAADVITAVTNSAEPVLDHRWVRPGTHINAVGAIAPAAIEIDPALIAHASLVVADSVAQVLDDSAEVRAAVETHGLAPTDVVPLHSVVTTSPVRDPAGISVFKPLGLGLADAAIAELAWRRHTST